MRIGLLAVALLVGALAGCSSTPPPGAGSPAAPTPATPAAPAAPGGATTGTVMTDPAQGYRPAHELQFTGLAEGLLTDARVDCVRVNPTTYAWTLSGALGGTPLQLTFNTNRYRGAGSYQVSGIGAGGVLTMTYGDRTATTDEAHTGTFTIDDNSETGSVEANLSSPDGAQRITGPWSCTGD